MGSSSSSEHESHNPRPFIDYTTLSSFSIVLIRSSHLGSSGGTGIIDSRIGSSIRHGSVGLQLAAEQTLPHWDRVGIIQLPSVDSGYKPHEYDADNVLVVEATYAGVIARTMRQVRDASIEVAVRQVTMPAQRTREAVEDMQRAFDAEDTKQFGQPMMAGVDSIHSALFLSAHASSSSSSSLFSSSSSSSLADFADDPDDRFPPTRTRLVVLSYQNDVAARRADAQRLSDWLRTIVGRPYASCMSQLDGMFRWVSQRLKEYDLSPAELLLMEETVQKYLVDFRGQDGRPARGVPFKSLLALFREMSSDHDNHRNQKQSAMLNDGSEKPSSNQPSSSADSVHIQNTFNDAEIYELVASFTQGDDRVTLSNVGHISASELLAHWSASITRTIPLRRLPREILSGAFVSQALQIMGVLPKSSGASTASATSTSSANESSSFYTPMEFAMSLPPVGGWPSSSSSSSSNSVDKDKPSGFRHIVGTYSRDDLDRARSRLLADDQEARAREIEARQKNEEERLEKLSRANEVLGGAGSAPASTVTSPMIVSNDHLLLAAISGPSLSIALPLAHPSSAPARAASFVDPSSLVLAVPTAAASMSMSMSVSLAQASIAAEELRSDGRAIRDIIAHGVATIGRERQVGIPAPSTTREEE